MGAAAVAQDWQEDLRTMAHDALDAWLDQLEQDTPAPPTLLEISERFMTTRQQLLGACLETVIRQHYAADLAQTEAVCSCGRRLFRRRLDAKEISTLHGRVTLHRPYFYCDPCGMGFHPLDAKLGLSPKHHQYDVQEQTTRVGAELPFTLSEEQFERLTGVAASPHFIHETLNAVGDAATLERVIPDAVEIGRRIVAAQGESRRRPVLVVACDGAHAPTRPPGGRKTKRGPGTWREAKGFRIYLLGKDQRVIHVASWHQIGDKAQLSVALGVVAARIPRDRVRIALVADGADWIWDVLLAHFPEGEQILDYYHCAEHVYETARAQYGDGTLQAQEWAEAALTRLCLNHLGETTGGLLRMKPRSPEAEEAIRKLSLYLAGQAGRVGYTELRRRGLPRGSGGIESANKLICHVRLKRSGAWWLEANGNAMLRIRCALYNGTFRQIFADYMAAQGGQTISP
ncbi:MAG: ISKra4 family transposase [Solirubrobacteraceae bacterium]